MRPWSVDRLYTSAVEEKSPQSGLRASAKAIRVPALVASRTGIFMQANPSSKEENGIEVVVLYGAWVNVFHLSRPVTAPHVSSSPAFFSWDTFKLHHRVPRLAGTVVVCVPEPPSQLQDTDAVWVVKLSHARDTLAAPLPRAGTVVASARLPVGHTVTLDRPALQSHQSYVVEPRSALGGGPVIDAAAAANKAKAKAKAASTARRRSRRFILLARRVPRQVHALN